MNRTNVRDFTEGNISRQLLTFALPLFMSNLLQVAYNMLDMVIVGNVMGKVGTSAVAVGGDVSHLLTFVAMGFSSAGQVIIARYIGAKKRERIGRFVGTMSFFLFASAIVLSVIGIVLRHELLGLMNTPDESYDGALAYSVISMVGLVFIYGYNTVSAILRGMGDSKHPFIFISLSAVMNLVLDVLFVIVLPLGAAGAALATVISQAASFILCTVFLVCHRCEFELNVAKRDFLSPDRAMLADLVKLGTPMAIKTASIQISKLFVNSWVNSYGVAVSAFAGIANKIASVSNLISQALNTAGSTMVGQNIAAGRFSRVKRIMLEIGAVTLVISLILSVLIAVFPVEIFALFTDGNDTDVTDIAIKYVPIAILLFLGSAARAVMNSLLNGSGNYRVNFATAIFDGIIMRIGLSVLFGLALGMKHYGFWLGDALAGFTPFFIGLVFLWSGAWKKGKDV